MANSDAKIGNRKIAEFMGGKGRLIHCSTEVYVFPNGNMVKLVRLNYHKHWNLIMPACHKMVCLKHEVRVIGAAITAKWYYSVSDLERALQTVEINQIYSALVKSIDKYNESRRS